MDNCSLTPVKSETFATESPVDEDFLTEKWELSPMPDTGNVSVTDMLGGAAERIHDHVAAGRIVLQIDFANGPGYYACTIYEGPRLIAAAQGENYERTLSGAINQARFSTERKQYPGDTDAELGIPITPVIA